MSGHHLQGQNAVSRQRRQRQLARQCGFGILALCASVSVVRAEEPASPSNRLRFPTLFRKTEAPPQQPSPRKDAEIRFISRAQQLMQDAREYESRGQLDKAHEFAGRAQGVHEAAVRTIGAKWPAGELTPAEYVRQLERRMQSEARAQAQKATAESLQLAAAEVARPQPQMTALKPTTVQPTATAAPIAADTPTTPAISASLGVNAATLQKRADSPLATPLTASIATETSKLIPSISDSDEAFSAEAPPAIAQIANDLIGLRPEAPFSDPDPAASNSLPAPAELNAGQTIDTVRRVLDSIESMQTWRPVSDTRTQPQSRQTAEDQLPAETSDSESSAPVDATENSAPTSGLTDENVGPIPTRIEHAKPQREGAVDIRAAELGGSAPEPLQHDHGIRHIEEQDGKSDAAPPAPPVDAGVPQATMQEAAQPASIDLWMTAVIQTAGTFVGVLMAMIVLLTGRAILGRRSRTTTEAEAPRTALANVPETAKPAVTELAQTASASITPTLRVIGTNDDERPAADVSKGREADATRTVFEQNVKLMEQLDNLSESAA